MSVVDDGILKGYVPIDKDWTGFSPEEYRSASKSCMETKPEIEQETAEAAQLDLSVMRLSGHSSFQPCRTPR